jgi:hypothetical protein
MTEHPRNPDLFTSPDESEEDQNDASQDNPSIDEPAKKAEEQPQSPSVEAMAETEPKEDRVLVLCSNWSIGGLFSRGCLLAPDWGENTDIAFLDEEWAHALPSHTNQLPANWVARIRADRRNSFPIAVRTRNPLEERPESLSLSNTDALIFSTEKERDLMLHTSFDDLSIKDLGINVEVDPSLFTGPDIDIPTPEIPSQSKVSAEALRRADCRAGLRAALPHIVPGKTDWISALGELWGKPSATDAEATAWIRAIDRGLGNNQTDEAGSNLEESLLTAISKVLSENYPVEKGWPGTDILTAILEELDNKGLSQRNLEILRKWGDQCRDVMAATEGLPLLDDSKGIPFRAGMYLLLRSGEVNLIRTSDAESPLVGTEVRALAGCLASVRTGMRNLSSPLKQATEMSPGRVWTQLVGDSLLTDLGLAASTSIGGKQSLSTKLESDIPLTGQWNLYWNGELLFRKEVDSDPVLRSISEGATEKGWVVEDLGKREIQITSILTDGKGDILLSHSPGSVLTCQAKVADLSDYPGVSHQNPIESLKHIWNQKSLEEVFRIALEFNNNKSLGWRSTIHAGAQDLVLLGQLPLSEEDALQKTLGEIEEIAKDAYRLAQKIRATGPNLFSRFISVLLGRRGPNAI